MHPDTETFFAELLRTLNEAVLNAKADTQTTLVMQSKALAWLSKLATLYQQRDDAAFDAWMAAREAEINEHEQHQQHQQQLLQEGVPQPS